MAIAGHRKGDDRVSVAISLLAAIGAFILVTNALVDRGQVDPRNPIDSSERS
jgi:hypothetical protein